MLDRLKSLPLTIVLTILIWMYAESQVTSVHATEQITVPDVPVWVSGPPAALERFEVEPEMKKVTITVSGAGAAGEALRLRVQAHEVEGSGVMAYLDVEPGDEKEPTLIRARLRYVLPEGITFLSGPAEVTYHLIPRLAASAPATGMP